MARSDLVLKLVRSGFNGDQVSYRKTVEALIAEERSRGHHVFADRLAECLASSDSSDSTRPLIADSRVRELLYELVPRRKLEDLILPRHVEGACRELIEEQRRSDLLRSYNLEPRHRVLLTGPPGNGKTSLAEAIAEALMVPFFVVSYEGVIASFLGETATRLKRLFDYVRTQRCVLFLDEFDVLGKERGDIHETGEIKRVVSSILLQVDALPSYVVIITASNHPELLDKAVWRRFQLRLVLPQPGIDELEEWFTRFQRDFEAPLGYSPRDLAAKLLGVSFAEAEEFGMDIRRQYVLRLPDADVSRIVAERINQWEKRRQGTGVSSTKGRR